MEANAGAGAAMVADALQTRRKQMAGIAVVLISVAIDLLGVSIILPTIPFLVMKFDPPSPSLVSCYRFGILH